MSLSNGSVMEPPPAPPAPPVGGDAPEGHNGPTGPITEAEIAAFAGALGSWATAWDHYRRPPLPEEYRK